MCVSALAPELNAHAVGLRAKSFTTLLVYSVLMSECARTCAGDCCTVIGVAFTYRDLLNRPDNHPQLRDRDTLLDMLEPISYETARQRMRTMTSFGEDYNPDTRQHFYVCNRWDEETKLCTRYDERPEMCSAYPYDNECTVPGCEYTPPQNVIDAWLSPTKESTP
jgi:Fe-S-cluster containining protein